MADADIVLLVLDASQPPHAGDELLRESIASRSHIIVSNKSDLALAYAADSIHTSALTGEGIPALRDAVLKLAGGSAQSETGMLTNIRQREAIEGALNGLAAAQTALTSGTPHEMLLLDIYAALRGLDALTGATTADDVLNLIFSSFCIGK
jgi:tRNA modification GTPase